MIPSIQAYDKLFRYYQQLGSEAMAQLPEEQDVFWLPSRESNSIAVIVQHLYGNMMSRWTDFLTTDGEKDSRNRDQEFELYVKDKAEMMDLWDKGWACLFEALTSITEQNQNRLVYIRQKGHTIDEALQRQLAHYAYHIGQIVFISRMRSQGNWNSLSIPKGQSMAYNKTAVQGGQRKEHFTAALINSKDKR